MNSKARLNISGRRTHSEPRHAPPKMTVGTDPSTSSHRARRDAGQDQGADALRQLPNGSWRLPFHPQDMIDSEAQNEGDHWDDWVASHCPALLLYGERSPVVSATQARAMVQRRPGTRVAAFDADHFLHRDQPQAFAAAVRAFLNELR